MFIYLRPFSIFLVLALFFLESCSSYKSFDGLRTPAEDVQESWQKASMGEHSFRSLGDDFYVDLPMKRVEGAKVVLINEAAARKLGLTNGDDIRVLEERLLKEYSFMVDKESAGQGEKNWFATRYQDSHKKAEGEALGDGRAAWAGEIILDPQGDRRNVDVVLKGIGQTPLAWTNHAQETHKDGLQGLKEAVHSFIISEANSKNQLDTTIDLAVIILPIKRVSKEGKEVDTAITVRVGNQTRLAHLRYFTDNSKQFKKIFDYIIKRDLGLPESSQVTTKEVERFLNHFTENIAEEMARYYDLHVTHGSPTPGNRTTLGSSIDLSTMRYHEAHHGDFRYLANMKMADQEKHLEVYIRYLYLYMQEAKYPFQVTETKVVEKEQLYRKLINEHLERLWLSRIGLSKNDINRIPSGRRKALVEFLKKMHEAEADETIIYAGRDMVPAAFDMRQIYRKTAELVSDPIRSQDPRAWEQLLTSEKSWSKISQEELAKWAHQYRKEIEKTFRFLEPGPTKFARWKKKANWVTKKNDAIRGQSKLKNKELDLEQRISKSQGSVSEWSREAIQLADELKDPDRPARAFNNLSPRRSCKKLLAPFVRQ